MISLLLPEKRILIIILTTLGLNLFVNAATITSTSSGGSWENASSWIGGVVPGPGDDVIIVSTAIITVTADAEARSLDVSGKIIINDGVTLTLLGNIRVENGAALYLSGNTSCTGNAQSILIVYGNYANYGYSCFWKSWVVIAGDLYSPSASGIQNDGFLVIGGNAVGIINQTGDNSVYPINPDATISLSGTTPITTAPTSPDELVAIIEIVIFGGSSCGFTIDGPANATACNGGLANFLINSTTATSPTFQWEVNSGAGWVTVTNSGVYSGVTTSTLSISNATGMNGYIFRCKITNASLCSKYSFSATLTVSATSAVGTVGQITGEAVQCPGQTNQTYTISPVLNASTYTWTVPTGWTITSGAGTTNIIITAGSSGQNGNISVTASNSCSSNSNYLAVTVGNIPAPAGNINGTASVCQGTTGVTYSVPAITNATNYIWSVPSGATISAGSNTNNITVSFSSSAISGNITVYGTNSCGNGTISAVYPVTVNPENTITLISGAGTNNQTRCINTTIMSITYSATGATGASVTGLPTGVTFNWDEDVVFIEGTPTVSGTFNYTITLTGGCGLVTASGIITVMPEYTITLSSAAGTNIQARCINTPITDITYSTTGATKASVTGLPAGVTVIWAADVLTITGIPSESGIFNYMVALTGGCGAFTTGGTLSVNHEEPVSVSVTADQNPVCPGNRIILTAIPVNGGITPSYQWKVNGLNVGNNSKTYSYIPVNNDEVTVVLTSNEACVTGNPAVSPPVTIEVDPFPSAPVVQIITQPTCAVPTGSVVLGNLPSGNWTINPGTITGNTVSAAVTGLDPGTYAFTVTTTAGCTSAASSEIILASPATTLSCSVSDQSDVLCKGDNTGSITVLGTGGQEPYQYKLESGAYQSSATFSSLQAGTYVITVQDANSCTSDVLVVISEPEQLNLSYSAKNASCVNVADGTVSILITGGKEPYTVLWSDGALTTNRTNIPAGDYGVVVTDANGCKASLDVKIGSDSYVGCLEIQEIITPNNDGFYDTWKIKNIEMYQNAEVRVYNRWGKLVFSTKNIPGNEWDGTMDGQPLPTDSYRYVLYLEKDQDPITGTVTIIR